MQHYIPEDRWWHISWWRHQMETFSASLAICAGNSPVPGEFPAQWPVTRSFDVFFDVDLRLNKRLSKQSWGWWFETLLRQLWRIVMLRPRRQSIILMTSHVSNYGQLNYLFNILFKKTTKLYISGALCGEPPVNFRKDFQRFHDMASSRWEYSTKPVANLDLGKSITLSDNYIIAIHHNQHQRR